MTLPFFLNAAQRNTCWRVYRGPCSSSSNIMWWYPWPVLWSFEALWSGRRPTRNFIYIHGNTRSRAWHGVIGIIIIIIRTSTDVDVIYIGWLCRSRTLFIGNLDIATFTQSEVRMKHQRRSLSSSNPKCWWCFWKKISGSHHIDTRKPWES